MSAANICALPSTGGSFGVILGLAALGVGMALVLLVRRSSTRLSVFAALPLLAAAGLGIQSVQTTECAPASTLGATTTVVAGDPSTSAPGSSDGGATTTVVSDLDTTAPSSTESTLPPAPGSSSTVAETSTTVSEPEVATTTSSVVPAPTTTRAPTTTTRPTYPPTTPRSTSTSVSPPRTTYAPPTSAREYEGHPPTTYRMPYGGDIQIEYAP